MGYVISVLKHYLSSLYLSLTIEINRRPSSPPLMQTLPQSCSLGLKPPRILSPATFLHPCSPSAVSSIIGQHSPITHDLKHSRASSQQFDPNCMGTGTACRCTIPVNLINGDLHTLNIRSVIITRPECERILCFYN